METPETPIAAGPSRRFFARWFDIYVATIVLALLAEMTLGRTYSWYVKFMNTPNSEYLVWMVFLPFALAVDAFICHLFGANLGKYLLGVQVKKIQGDMNLNDWISRASNVWRSGFAFGFPLLSLWTLLRESRLVSAKSQASYDARGGYQVFVKPLSKTHKAVGVVAIVGIYLLVAWLNGVAKERDRKIAKAAVTPPYVWQNPITKREAAVDAEWRHDGQRTTDGSQTYTFTELTEHALIVLGLESGPSTLNDYAKLFQKETAEYMSFNDGGRYFEQDGIQMWVCFGSMNSLPGSRLRVEVRKDGNDFWRVVTIQSEPFDFTNPKVLVLAAQLWKTIVFQSTSLNTKKTS